jgi:putative ABC transport system permease protein
MRERAFFAKMGRDLVSRAGRWAVLAVVLGAGIFLLTTVGTSAAVLLREMSANYESTRPASATIELEKPWTGTELPAVPGLAGFRAGQSLWLRALDRDGHWQPFLVFVNRGGAGIEAVRPVSGPWPPAEGTVALERTALPTFGWASGQTLSLRTAEGRPISVTLGTVVHDPAVAPAYQERAAYAYVTERTMAAWGLLELNQLKVRFDQGFDTAAVRNAATELGKGLEAEGIRVRSIEVPPVHRHPHQGILSTLLLILGSFGALTIVLGSFLAANAAAAYFAREKKSIGILKTVGVPRYALLVLVLAPMAAVGIAAVAWGVPAGLAVMPVLVRSIAELLNFTLGSLSPESWSWMLPLVFGLFTPLLLTLPRAWAAVDQPALAALIDQGLAPKYAVRRPSAFSRRFPLLAMSVRNAARRPGRLALNLTLMGVGGALFLTGANLALGWNTGLDESLAARKFDWQLRLTQPPAPEQVEHLRVAVNPIGLDVWPSAPAGRLAAGWPINATYPDEAHGSFRALGVPSGSPLIAFPLLAGRQRHAPDEVVLNQSAKARFPEAKPGDEIALAVGSKHVKLRLAGVVKETGQAAAYVDPSLFDGTERSPGSRWDVVVAVQKDTPRSEAVQWAEAERLPLEVFIDGTEYREGGAEHFALLIAILTLMGLVTGLVGWLGVSSLLGLSVAERRRELGILRTVGAGPRRLVGSLLAEAALMLALGFGAALLLSLPLTLGLGSFLGIMAQQAPLPLMVDIGSATTWLSLSLAGGLLACLVPALSGSRSAVRETLTSQ